MHSDMINSRKQPRMKQKAGTDFQGESKKISKIVPVDAAIYVEK